MKLFIARALAVIFGLAMTMLVGFALAMYFSYGEEMMKMLPEIFQR